MHLQVLLRNSRKPDTAAALSAADCRSRLMVVEGFFSRLNDGTDKIVVFVSVFD